MNVGALDSTLRVTLGFALLFVAFVAAPPLKYLAYVGCLVFVITGLAGRCPLYTVFGIHTCAKS